MRNNAPGFLALLGAGLLLVGCGDDSSACGADEFLCDEVCISAFEPTLADIQTNVFDLTCTASSCHDAQNPQANLDLSSVTASETNLINVDSTQFPGTVRVAPSNVDASYLWNKLTGSDIAEGTDPMPQGGFPLCDARLDVIELWITDGAPIN